MPQQDFTSINAQLAQDPQWQQIVNSQTAAGPGLSKNLGHHISQIKTYLASKGIQLPEGYWVSQGRIEKAPSTASQVWDVAKVLGPAALALAAPVALPALLGGGAGGAAAGAAGGGSAAAGTGAAVAGKSIWDVIAGPLIGAGTNILGTAMANSANSNAAKIAADAAKSSELLRQQAEDRALQVQTDAANRQQANTAPYRQAGTGALNLLGYGAGIPGYTSPTSGNTLATPDKPITVPPMGGQPQAQASAATPNALSSLAQPQAAPMVKVKSPSGQMGTIPQNRLQEAMAAGFQQVNA